jgi:uncharacterized protein YecE (DUF72 family)
MVGETLSPMLPPFTPLAAPINRVNGFYMGGKILTGTASWSDPGFVADWYPAGLPASRQLAWYAEHFNLVEVNSTFYRIPDARSVQRWCEQTPHGFKFDVKLHRSLSHHSTKPEMLPPKLRAKTSAGKGRVKISHALEKALAKEFLRGIEPLLEEGKLGALLLQLSPEFGPRRHELEELDSLVEKFHEYNLAVELRNGGWVSPERLDRTRKYFSRRHLIWVMVDGPSDPHFTIMPSLDIHTNHRVAYIRAHGRNARGYIRGRSVAARFDYDYPESELREIAARAARAAETAKEVHVIYNNNKSDYAPRAAQTFQNIVEAEFPAAATTKHPHEEQQKLVYA